MQLKPLSEDKMGDVTNNTRLRRASLQWINDSPDVMAECRDLFTMITKDRDCIDPAGMKDLMSKMGRANCSHEEVTKMIADLDKTGSGVLDFESFCSMMNTEFLSKGDHDDALLQAFNTFAAGSGSISGRQLETMLNQIMPGEKDTQDAMMALAADKMVDGKLSLDAFKEMVADEEIEEEEPTA